MSEQKIKTLKPHISINVKNVTESVDFYKKLFGIEPMKFIEGVSAGGGSETVKSPRSGYAKFDVANPPLNFVLNEISYSKGGALSHLGIQVASTDDVLQTRERWIAEGLVTTDEMNVDCCYALQDKTWARDPDGNEWEVFVVLENTEPAEASCACGTKLENKEISTEVCCTETQKASTIGASNQACC